MIFQVKALNNEKEELMVANKSLAEYNLTQVRFLISRKKNSAKNCENSTPFIHFNHSRRLIHECDFDDDVILYVK